MIVGVLLNVMTTPGIVEGMGRMVAGCVGLGVVLAANGLGIYWVTTKWEWVWEVEVESDGSGSGECDFCNGVCGDGGAGASFVGWADGWDIAAGGVGVGGGADCGGGWGDIAIEGEVRGRGNSKFKSSKIGKVWGTTRIGGNRVLFWARKWLPSRPT